MAEPIQDNTPLHSQAFGPAEDADATRQAQHQMLNDAPVDVNMNAVVAREQAATLTLMGKNFEAASARRNNIADAYMGKLMKEAGGA